MGLYLNSSAGPCEETKVCLAQMPLSPAVSPNLFFKSEFPSILLPEDSSGKGRIGVLGIFGASCHRDMSHLLAEALVFGEDTSNQN